MKTKAPLNRVHFLHRTLFNPTNPVSFNIIGAGGTGSHLALALARVDYALVALGNAGLHCTVYDHDCIDTPNFGRSEFNQNYNGINKAVAVVTHINRCFGTNWKAVPLRFENLDNTVNAKSRCANITVSCVDSVDARFHLADTLKTLRPSWEYGRDIPYYWMDFGNTQYTGQAIFSTLEEINQPDSKIYTPIGRLPLVTEEFSDLLKDAKSEDEKPSCSIFDSLSQQSLFINSALANYGGSFIQELLTTGMTGNRGFFMNLKDFKSEPLKV